MRCDNLLVRAAEFDRVKVPLSHVREGCTLLISRIRTHAADARTLWDGGHYPGAYLLILLAFEELGKLLELIQSAGTSERAGLPDAEITSYLEKGAKASHAAKASLSSQYIQRGLNLVAWAMRQTGLPEDALGRYSDHLLAIGAGFSELRSSLMYVDYVDGTWSRGRPVDKENLDNDIGALEFVATLIEAFLQGSRTFADLVDASMRMEVEMREKLPEMVREIIARYAELVKQNRP